MEENQNNNLTMPKFNHLRIALVHDFLVQQGGAEKVLEAFSEMFPAAPIYTLLYNKEKMGEFWQAKDIRVSYLRKFPKFLQRNYRWLLPFFPVIPETFDLRNYDLVISSTGAWSKGIITRLDTTHVAYLHSPLRFAWDHSDKYVREIKQKNLSFLVRFVLSYLRVWDRLAADRPDYLIANSCFTKKRIAKYYRRDSEVIYPPVSLSFQARGSALQGDFEMQRLEPKAEAGSYFLVVSRLSPYKKVDLVVETFNKLGLPLVVIGTGEQENYLRKLAKANIQILGWKDAQEVADYMQDARAFIFPGEDDFGIAPVEAMGCGVPVLAYRAGGVLETVQEGISGEFFDAQTPEVLADGIRRLMENEAKYDKALIRARAQEFSKAKFKKEFEAYLKELNISPKEASS